MKQPAKKTIKKKKPVIKKPLTTKPKLVKQQPAKKKEPIKKVIKPPKTYPKPKQKQLGKTKAQVKLRSQKVAEGLIAGKTAKDSILAAGYSMSVALKPTELLDNPLFKQTYCEILDKAGATDDACASVISAAMKAKKVEWAKEKDEVKYKEVDDHPTRLKAVDMVHKVRGRYVEKKIVSGPDGGPIQVKAVELSDEELFAIARRGRAGTTPKEKSTSKPS